MVEELKWLRLDDLGQPDLARTTADGIAARLARLPSTAKSLGLTVKRAQARKGPEVAEGRVVGFEAAMPDMALLTRKCGVEAEWRFYSGVAHGYAWATFSGGYKRVSRNAITQDLDPNHAYSILVLGLDSWLRSAAALFKHVGWQIKDAADDCDPYLDRAGIGRERRPWRTKTDERSGGEAVQTIE